MIQFIIGLIIGICVYIGVYFFILHRKKKKQEKSSSDINENIESDKKGD